MDETAATRDTILRALRALDSHRYIVTEDQEGYWVTVNDGKRPMRWFIPPALGHRYCNETIHHFKIPKEWIQHPLSIPGDEDNTRPC